VDDPRRAVEVALLERDPFAGPQAGGGGEDDHRPVGRVKMRGEPVDLRPRFERTLLRVLPPWVVDAGPRRVRVDDPPGNGSVQDLA
jgi:hypothetical protein